MKIIEAVGSLILALVLLAFTVVLLPVSLLISVIVLVVNNRD